jgi:hypothetical protein
MRPTPIAQVLRAIQPVPPEAKAERLKLEMKDLPKRSVLRREYESALKHVVIRDLQRANREAR